MPEIDFDPVHKRVSTGALEFDRLKLKKDEKARIVLLEKPTFAFVHTLRAPKIVNGVAVKVEKESRKGGTYVDYDMDFVGRPHCLGDYGILTDKGVDPANCPACKRSTQTDEVFAPDRRFAMNVVKYGMTRDGKLVQPFTCANVVWDFTEGVYNRLIDIAEEHGALVGRDLLLGPCTNEGFQKFEIQAGAQSLWQANDAIKTTVVATYQQNRIPELERACGRKVQTAWLLKDLDSIAERWRIARGETDGTEMAGAAALTEGLADLLGSSGTTTLTAQPAVDMNVLLGTSPSPDVVPTAEQAPATAGPAQPASPAGPPDFGDLLGTGTPPPAEQTQPAPAAAKSDAQTYDFGLILDGIS